MGKALKIILIVLLLSTFPVKTFAEDGTPNKRDSLPFIQYTNINNFKSYTTVLTIQEDGQYTIEKNLHNKKFAGSETIEDGKVSFDTIKYMTKLIADCDFFELDDRDFQAITATDQSQIELTISLDKKEKTLAFESLTTLKPKTLAELVRLISKIIWSD